MMKRTERKTELGSCQKKMPLATWVTPFPLGKAPLPKQGPSHSGLVTLTTWILSLSLKLILFTSLYARGGGRSPDIAAPGLSSGAAQTG